MNSTLELPDPFPERRAQFGQLPRAKNDEDDQNDNDQMPRLEDAFKHVAPPVTGTGGDDSLWNINAASCMPHRRRQSGIALSPDILILSLSPSVDQSRTEHGYNAYRE
jgi:hypothetical protein